MDYEKMREKLSLFSEDVEILTRREDCVNGGCQVSCAYRGCSSTCADACTTGCTPGCAITCYAVGLNVTGRGFE